MAATPALPHAASRERGGSLTANVTSGCSAAGERQQPARRGPGNMSAPGAAEGGGRSGTAADWGGFEDNMQVGPGRGWRRRGGTEPSGP